MRSLYVTGLWLSPRSVLKCFLFFPTSFAFPSCFSPFTSVTSLLTSSFYFPLSLLLFSLSLSPVIIHSLLPFKVMCPVFCYSMYIFPYILTKQFFLLHAFTTIPSFLLLLVLLPLLLLILASLSSDLMTPFPPLPCSS